jgi:hypothetical protein
MANLDRGMSFADAWRDQTEFAGADGESRQTFSRGAERLRRVRVCTASTNQ